MTVCFDSFVFKLKRKLHYYKYTIILCLLTKYSVGWFRWVCFAVFRWVCLLCFVVFVEFRWVVSPFRWVCFVVFRWVCFVGFVSLCFVWFVSLRFVGFVSPCFAGFVLLCFVGFVSLCSLRNENQNTDVDNRKVVWKYSNCN